MIESTSGVGVSNSLLDPNNLFLFGAITAGKVLPRREPCWALSNTEKQTHLRCIWSLSEETEIKVGREL